MSSVHLLQDIISLLPHSRKDAKLDTKSQLSQLNELADLYNCNNILFFEARKAKDLYIWLSKPPNGPTVKFHCQNVHTMEELNFTGNCLRGSRPVLSFDKAFDGQAHTRLIKELLTHVFGVPQSSRKVKPFVDHIMGFTIADGKIWIRCYQISETEASKTGSKATDQENEAPSAAISAPKEGRGETSVSLVEIGPRFVLTPIVILEGSFGGPVIYENKEFVSPNQIRSDLRRTKAGRYNTRAEGTLERKVKRGIWDCGRGRGGEVDELDERVLFA
ncbi:Ribosome biogenesis protein BRX1 [Friedmanniomyces simplex]|uniref:Ribosome biogenesis protein BRX1 n=1 Tax=Friedmanniomyces simplex TaxID=329884 RepID=A0A4U0XTN1_9PEZI|nr:Ribosome biogenesis protein BRX1 [Friedmanniomyces simplex]